MKSTAALLATAAAVCIATPVRAGDDAVVRVYLPRNVKVTCDALTLGDIALVRCADANTERRAQGLKMGRAPWPREQLVFSRATILSCLGGRRIVQDRVRLSGAPAVTVMRRETVLTGEKLQAAAEDFLRTLPDTDGTDCIYRVRRKPAELVVSGRADVTLVCALAKGAAPGRVKVAIAASRDGRQVGLREATFQRLYKVRRAVAIAEIPAGAALSKENVELRTDFAEQPSPGPWKPPFGLLARRRLAAGTVIRDSLVAEKKPDLVIRRNQVVRMRVQGLGFTVLALGQALQDGRPGDFIRVRNVDSRRIVTVRVAFDGSVEPALGR